MDARSPQTTAPRPKRPGVKRIGRGGGLPGGVGEHDLQEFVCSVEDDNVARLEQDVALVNRLMWNGYTGPEYQEFVKVLAGYGVQVIRSWVRTGFIFVKCSQRGFGLNNILLGRSPSEARDDAQALANETVAVSIVGFRTHVLIPGKWRPDKGASLRTYFIGQCVLRFPNVYRAWVTETLPAQIDGVLPEMVLPPAVDPHEATVLALKLKELRSDPKRFIVALRGMGYTQPEIAELLGTTWRAIESRLQRLKKKAKHAGA